MWNKVISVIKSLISVLFVGFVCENAHAATLPSGYTELRYIQSDGNQIINTGYVLQETDSVEVDYVLTNLSRTGDKFIIGAQPIQNNQNVGFWVETYGESNNWYVRYGSSQSANTYGTTTPSSQLSGTFIVSKNSFVVNGTKILEPNFNGMSPNPMTIFNRISADGSIPGLGASVQISAVRIKNGTNIVRKYIPARNSNNELGLYEITQGQFLNNQGSGSFTAGEYPSTCNANTINLADMTGNNVVIGKYISSAGNVTNSEYNFYNTKYIPVKPNTTYTLSASSPLYYLTISEYSSDSTGGFIKRNAAQSTSSSAPFDLTSMTITTGATTQYIRFGSNMYKDVTLTLTDVNSVNWMLTETSTAQSYVPYSVCAGFCANLLQPNTYTDGYYYTQTGEYTDAAPARLTDFIPVVAGQPYTIKSMKSGSSNLNLRVNFFDSNKTWLSQSVFAIGNSGTFVYNTVTPQQNGYIRVSANRDIGSQNGVFIDYNTYMIVQGEYDASNYPEYCVPERSLSQIKIATRAYNTTQFAPVVTALNTAIDTIKDVVTNTINQTAAVSALQSTKQQRPADACPDYKQCLLVETEDGTPQWFVITDPFRDLFSPVIANNIAATGTSNLIDGYTQVEYIESTGTQYITTPIKSVRNGTFYVDFQMVETPDSGYPTVWGAMPTTSDYKVVIGSGTEKIYSQVGNGLGYVNTINKNTNRRQATVTISEAGETVVIDGQTFSKNFVVTADNEMPLTLFARKKYDGMGNFAKVKLYSAWHKNADNEYDFYVVPVLNNVTGKYGMYDKVNNVFYGDESGLATDFSHGNAVANDADVPAATSWSITFSANDTYGYGRSIVYGTAKCNATSGSANDVATSTQMSANNWTATGSNCWCYAERVNETSSGSTGTAANRWVYLTVPSGETCAANCVENCADAVASGAAADKPFRQALVGI